MQEVDMVGEGEDSLDDGGDVRGEESGVKADTYASGQPSASSSSSISRASSHNRESFTNV